MMINNLLVQRFATKYPTSSYLVALPDLLRVCRGGLIIKGQDATDDHTFMPGIGSS